MRPGGVGCGMPVAGAARRRLLAAWPAAALTVGLGAWPGRSRADTPGVLHSPWPRSRPTPPLELPAWGSGAPWRLADQRGKVVLLNFWASWCEPCRAELPSLELLAQRHESDGLLVMAVNYREGEAAIHRFVERMPLSLPILRDADGAAARAFAVRLFPTTVAVARDGRAVFTVAGELDWKGPEALRWLAPLLSANLRSR